MVVMAIMSLMAWQGVDGIVRARESNQVRLEQTLRLETVMAQWEQDLASLQETTAVPALSCDGQSVRLTRRTDDGMQVVVWSLRPDAHGNVWQRWAGPAVTTTSAPAGDVASHAAVPGQRDRPAAHARRPRLVAGLLLPGRVGQLPVDAQRGHRPAAAPASSTPASAARRWFRRLRARHRPADRTGVVDVPARRRCRPASASCSRSRPAAAWSATSRATALIAP